MSLPPQLLDALRQSADGFATLDEMIAATTAAFDNGDDAAALQGVSDIARALTSFAAFVAAISPADGLAPADLAAVNQGRRDLENAIAGLNQSLQQRDFVSTADALRYDVRDCLAAFAALFRRLAG